MTKTRLVRCGYLIGGLVLTMLLLFIINEHRDTTFQVNATELRTGILKCHTSPLLRNVIAKYPLPFKGFVRAEVACDFPFQYYIRVT